MELKGLSSKEAQKRLKLYGPNEIKRIRKLSAWKILLEQFKSPLILILLVAAIISLVITFIEKTYEISDSILILLIVFISSIAGFFQNWKAERTIEALQKLAMPKAKVIRDSEQKEIPVSEIVPGDLIIIEAGDVVPADSKIIESHNLQIDESILTGESQAVDKRKDDLVYMHTYVFSGNAKALVVKTGMRTEIGKLASKMQEIEEVPTAFQQELEKFSKKICIGIVLLLVFIALAGYFKFGLYLALLTAISLAVAAIPEGLPAVLTLSLALGAREMAKKKALIRKLPIVESIGAIDIICTDKTGTLTENKMSVRKVFFDGRVWDVKELNTKEAELLLKCCALCNNTSIIIEDGKKVLIGDQTEIALRRFAEEKGFVKEELEKVWKRTKEISFSSVRKMMSVECEFNGKYFVWAKGAPEVLVEKCNRIYINGKVVRLTKKLKQEILKMNEKFASKALRVLGIAYKDEEKPIEEKEMEKELIWLGLVGLIDPPRKEVKKALEDCKNAGIRVIMITGDNPLTAKAIADEIGLETKGVLEGKDIDKLSDEELEEKLSKGINIFARTSPFHKLRILELLQKKHRVAMTGDGVNDSLALKKADVGIAMGMRGTEVAKEASDMILLDDNFATIRDAIREGRRIFDNIRKFINYLFVCNLSEVLVIFFATLFIALNEPILLPVQILWINLLTDGLPAIALGLDPARKDVMQRPPRKKEEGIINRQLALIIGVIGLKKAILLFIVFLIFLFASGIEIARTVLFTGFILYEFVRIAVIRYQEELSWFANKILLLALGISLALQLLIIYTPLGKWFYVVPLGIYEWLILLVGIIIGWVSSIALTKLIMKWVKD
jgi:Ca2+-transporting ATPase